MRTHLHDYVIKYYPEFDRMETYSAEDVVSIRGINEEWGILGNFAHTPVCVKGVAFDTSERLFQTMKMKDTDAVRLVYNTKAGFKYKVRHIESAEPELLREDWGRIFIDAMKFCLQVKYEQSESFRHTLSLTGNRIIVEDQTKFPGRNANTWGAKLKGDSFVGPNVLGKLLMSLRDQGKLDYVLPEDILDFLALL